MSNTISKTPEEAKQAFEEFMANEFDQELKVNEDLHSILRLLLAIDWRKKEQAEEISSALIGYETKYGRALIRNLEEGINNLVDIYAESILEGDYEE